MYTNEYNEMTTAAWKRVRALFTSLAIIYKICEIPISQIHSVQ